MKRSAKLSWFVPLTCAVLAAATVRAEAAKSGEKIPLRVEDLYLAESFEPAVIAADERKAACIREWVDEKSQRARKSLWLVEATVEKRRALEAGEPDARSPVFSPDGNWIVIQSKRALPNGYPPLPTVPAASDPVTDLWLVPVKGGKAIPLAGPDKAYGRVFDDPYYGHVAFSPDGKKLVFIADDGGNGRTPEELSANVEIVRPDQGEGYTGYRAAQVWVAELSTRPGDHAATRIVRLTDDDVWYGDPQWTPDGARIVVHANKTKDRESVRWNLNKNFELWEIKVVDHTQRQLTHTAGADVFPRISPDGSRLLCLSAPRNGGHYDIFDLAIVTLDAELHLEVLVDSDHLKNGQWEPSLALRDKVWDGAGHVVYEGVRGVKGDLLRVDVATGEAVPLISSKYRGPESELQRLHKLRARMTPPGGSALAERLAAENRVITWKNDEGQTIEGALTLPPKDVARAPYKMILLPHGGPHGRDNEFPSFTAQVFAANGYAVFRPNFRGSVGYGRKFLDGARRDIGGSDMRDMLTGIDYLVSEKLVDPKRQFVYGVSYGGFTACWLVGHTNQFRAAVAQNAVTEMNAMWGTSDLPSWTEWELGGSPWDVPDAMRKASPFAYAPQVHTPTLILHSREDRRCPLAMGRMFYQALRANGVETAMVIYPDEGHLILQPRHQADVLRRTLDWFAAHDFTR
jgi:dipeptidyl aminopeptidase/acylaminoacyl peptidase